MVVVVTVTVAVTSGVGAQGGWCLCLSLLSDRLADYKDAAYHTF